MGPGYTVRGSAVRARRDRDRRRRRCGCGPHRWRAGGRQGRRASTAAAPGSTCARSWRLRAPAGGVAGHRADARVHHGAARRAGHHRRPSRPSTAQTPLGTDPHGQPHRARSPARGARPHRPRRALRHQAVQRVPLRRRQRRRIERGVPARAGARAEGAGATRLTIELLFLDGEEATSARLGAAPTTPTAAGTTWRPRSRAGSLRTLEALVLVDMIGDRDLRIMREANSTPWLTDIVWAAARRAGLRRVLRRRSRRRSRTTTCRSSQAGVAVGRHHRPRLPRLAHRRRYAGAGLRPQPADRRRGPRPGVARYRAPAGQMSGKAAG